MEKMDMHQALKDAMYVLDDDLKDAAYYVDAAKKAKEVKN